MKSYVKVTGVKNFTKMPKFAGIDLSCATRVSRGGKYSATTGISTRTFGNVWFLLPEGQALFKTFDGTDYKNTRNLRMINELVCAELLSQIGLSHAEYAPASIKIEDKKFKDPADIDFQAYVAYMDLVSNGILEKDSTSNKKLNGIITYNFLGLGEKLVPLGRLIDVDGHFTPTLEATSERLKTLQTRGYKVSRKKLILHLYALSAFDFLTKQTDRNTNNTNIILDEQSNVKPAKVIDNEFAFFGQYFTGDRMKKNEHDYDEMLKFYNDYARTIPLLTNNSESMNRLEDSAKDLVAYAIIHPELRHILTEIMKKIDVPKAVESTRAKGVEISDEYADFMNFVVNSSKQELKNLIRMKQPQQIFDTHEKLF